MDVLVSVEHDGGVAGVFREDGWTLLSADLEGGGGTGLSGHRPAFEGWDDRSVHGGLTPEGTVRVEVLGDDGVRRDAAVGGGAWVLVLDQPAGGHGPPVRFVDADGNSVVPSLPADWPRTPVADAKDPCLACGALAWDEVMAIDGSRGHGRRGDGPEEPARVVVCRACGHEEPMGMRVTLELPDDDETEDHEELQCRWAQKRRERVRAALGDVPFAVYAATGHGTPAVDGWGSSGSRVSQVRIAHGDGVAPPVEVESTTDAYGGPLAAARGLLSLRLRGAGDDSWRRLSDAAHTVHTRAVEHRATVRAARAVPTPTVLTVAGRPVEFTAVGDGPSWVAVGSVEGVRVIVVTHGVPLGNVALDRVDPTAL